MRLAQKLLLLVSIFYLHHFAAYAQTHSPYIPNALSTWKPWVLEKHRDLACPFNGVDMNQRQCVWPTSIQLHLAKNGAGFDMQVVTYADSLVELPGQKAAWPSWVGAGHNGKNKTRYEIIERSGRPYIFLKKGSYLLNGEILWNIAPQRLGLPSQLAQLKVFSKGKELKSFKWDEHGTVWLQERKQDVDPLTVSSLNIKVFRKFEEATPFKVTTRLNLDISGPPREALLRGILLPGLSAIQIQGPLAFDLKKDGSLLLKLQAGHWSMTITSLLEKAAIETLAPTQHRENMPAQEIWVYKANNDIRMVKLEGVASIDPGQFDLPSDFKGLPTYLMRASDRLTFKEIRRGDSGEQADKLTLERNIWPDFQGNGATITDHIRGEINRSWRLDMSHPFDLGSVNIDGHDQVITLSADDPEVKGVEVRNGNLDMQAVSRLVPLSTALPVSGWKFDFNNANTTVHLPPGWSVLAVTGTDSNWGTWVDKWTLLAFFFVFVVALGTFKLKNLQWALLTFFTLVLCYPENNFPTWIWLHMLLALGLSKVATQGTFAKLVYYYKKICQVALLILCFSFAVAQLQSAIYPIISGHDNADDKSLMPEVQSLRPPPAAMQNEPSRMLDRAEQRSSKKSKSRVRQQEMAAPAELAKAYQSQEMLEQAQNLKSATAQTMPLTLSEFDPKATVQTGPGIPNWSWNSVSLSWSGPVKKDQQVRILMIGATTNRLLSLLRILLLFFVVGSFMQWKANFFRPISMAVMLFFLLATPGQQLEAQESFPSATLLSELEQRLLLPPACLPNCLSFGRLDIAIAGEQLELEIEVQSLADTYFALPINFHNWSPTLITLDGKPSAVLSSIDGRAQIHSGAGIHKILLKGEIKKLNLIELPFDLRPHYLSFNAKGWVMEGTAADGQVGDSLLLRRTQNISVTESKRSSEKASQNNLLPYISVRRHLHLGLKWRVTTTVSQLSSRQEAVTIHVTSLPGETVIDQRLSQKDNQVEVHLSPQLPQVTWTSDLKITPLLSLNSADVPRWNETWEVTPSPIWNVQSSGLIPTYHKDQYTGVRKLTFHPQAKESVTLKIQRPQGAPGQTQTILGPTLTLTPSKRASKALLEMTVKTSKGGSQHITLPEKIELTSISINNQLTPIKLKDHALDIPLEVGSNRIKLEWTDEAAISSFYQVPNIILTGQGANVNLHIKLPPRRWILALGGPSFGPVVLFWGKLLLLLLAAYLLARSKLTYLSTWQWCLLTLGLTQIPLTGLLIVMAFFIVIGMRNRFTLKPLWHNLTLLGTLFLTLLTAGTFVSILSAGLLDGPQMEILGNNSYASQLNWYQDRLVGNLPHAWVFSTPEYVFKLLMLFWGLWLAFFLIKQGPIIWASLSHQGLWKKNQN